MNVRPAIFDDIDQAVIEEVLPHKPGSHRPTSGVIVKSIEIRSSRRLSIGFTEDIWSEIGRPTRASVGYVAPKKLIVVSGDDARGRYEFVMIGKNARLRYIRIPLPHSLAWDKGSEFPEFYVDAAGLRVAIEVPSFLLPRVQPLDPRFLQRGKSTEAIQKAAAARPAPNFSSKQRGEDG